MKTLFYAAAITAVFSTMSFTYASEASAKSPPRCEPLTVYTLFDVNNNDGPWSAFYDGGAGIMNQGGIIDTDAPNKKIAKDYANYAQKNSQVRGHATKVPWDDKSYFWVCSLSYENYTATVGVKAIETFSGDYNSEGELTERQSTLQEKVLQLRQQ